MQHHIYTVNCWKGSNPFNMRHWLELAYLHLWSRGWAGCGRYPSSPAVVSAGPYCSLWPCSAGLLVPWWPHSAFPLRLEDFPSLASVSPAPHGVASPFLTSSALAGCGKRKKGHEKFIMEDRDVFDCYNIPSLWNSLEWGVFSWNLNSLFCIFFSFITCDLLKVHYVT